MTELKTLKDIDLSFEIVEFACETVIVEEQIEKIRAEAIKWVKALRYSHKHYNGKEMMTVEQRDFLIDWIQLFFGITEEDLK